MRSRATLFSLRAPGILLAVCLLSAGWAATVRADDHPPAGPGETDVGWDDRVGRELMNLGPIGVRGFLQSDGGKFPMHYLGHNITVRKVFDGSPAAGFLQEDDVITGVNGRKLQPPDCQFMIAEAILDAEGGDGKLTLQFTRSGAEQTATIILPKLGRFAPTAPYACAKSRKLLDNACQWIVKQQQPDGGWTLGGGTISADIACLTLLGSGDPKYFPICKSTAQWMLDHRYEAQGWNWHFAFNALFLSEYYLDTHDASVLPALQRIETAMMNGQISYPPPNQKYSGGWAHSILSPQQTAQLKDPNILPSGLGYTELNIAAMQNVAALGMMKQCGIKVDQKRIDMALNYLENCSDVAPGISYSNWGMTKVPINGNGTESGFNSTYPSIFAIDLSEWGLANSPFTKRNMMWATNPANNSLTPFGHAEHHFGLFWTPCAMALLDPAALIRYTKQMQDYYTLCRMYDGSFTTLPSQEEVIAKSSCGREFGRIWSTGWQGMILALGQGHLHIAGGMKSAARALPGPLRDVAHQMDIGEFGGARYRLKELIAGAGSATGVADNSQRDVAEQMLSIIDQEAAGDVLQIRSAKQSGDVYQCLRQADRFLAKYGLGDPNAAEVSGIRNQIYSDEAAMREMSVGKQYYALLDAVLGMAPADRIAALKQFASQHADSKYAAMALQAATDKS